MDLFLTTLYAALIICIYFLLQNGKSSKSQPPKLFSAIPYVGHAVALMSDPHGFFSKSRRLGPLYTAKIMGRETVIVADKELFKEYYRMKDESFSFHDMLRVVYEVMFGTPNSHLSEINLKAVVLNSTQKYEAQIAAKIREMIKDLPDSGVLDLERFSIDVICYATSVAFIGTEIDQETTDLIFEFEKHVMKAARSSFIFPVWLARLRYLSGAKSMRERIVAKLLPLVREAKRQHEAAKAASLSEEEETVRFPMATAYTKVIFEEKAEDGVTALTDEELALVVFGVFFGAFANSIRATANIMFLAAEFPDKCVELEKEMEGKTLPDSKLLEAWVKETARVSNGHLGSMRKVMNDVSFGGYTIPKGTNVAIDKLTDFHIENYDRFEPERFITKSDYHQYLINNWGGGAHMCPGKRFAVLEMKVTLKTVLEQLKLTKIGNDAFKPVFNAGGTMEKFQNQDYKVLFEKKPAVARG